jgi:hypothetical protein
MSAKTSSDPSPSSSSVLQGSAGAVPSHDGKGLALPSLSRRRAAEETGFRLLKPGDESEWGDDPYDLRFEQVRSFWSIVRNWRAALLLVVQDTGAFVREWAHRYNIQRRSTPELQAIMAAGEGVNDVSALIVAGHLARLTT